MCAPLETGGSESMTPLATLSRTMRAPDGRWILFDRAAPSGGDIWLLEGIE